MLADRRATRIGFNARLYARWRHAFDLFETVLVMAQEAGEEFYQKHRPQDTHEHDFVFEVLTRLQARACLVASEVYALMVSGHASGANARWRTLHEIVVVGYFIKEHGQGTAERYLLHHTIESARIAEEYQQFEARLGLEPISEQELIDVRTEADALCQRFGPAYRGPYGWAAAALDSANPRLRPTFAQIEQAVSLHHWRPYYGIASHGVHAKPKGIMFDIGRIGPRDMLLAGPSNTGFADPGSGALVSLSQITTNLLALHPGITEVVAMHALVHFVEEAGQVFLGVQQQIADEERNEEALRNSPAMSTEELESIRAHWRTDSRPIGRSGYTAAVEDIHRLLSKIERLRGGEEGS